MGQIILEAIAYFVVEVIFGGFILGIFKVMKLIGLMVLKVIRLSNQSIEELREVYKDSSLPYFLGFGLSSGIIYLLIKLTS